MNVRTLRGGRLCALSQKKRETRDKEGDVLDESTHAWASSIRRSVDGFQPRSCQAKRPQHSFFIAHLSHSPAKTFFQSEMLLDAVGQRLLGSTHNGMFMNRCGIRNRLSTRLASDSVADH
jgi:hypothetical protein